MKNLYLDRGRIFKFHIAGKELFRAALCVYTLYIPIQRNFAVSRD